VIYTSGSTGRPKGVAITHASVVRLMASTQELFHFSAADVWTLFHSFAFDFSVWELWGALLHGGRLVIVSHDVARAPDAFYALLQREHVTVINQTPSAFRLLTGTDRQVKGQAAPLSLRLIIFGGEALDRADLQPWIECHGLTDVQLVNMYGITETTVHVTHYPLSEADIRTGAGSPIGRPIPGVALYVLDQHLNRVPIGVPGEIYVGGSGLARGYLGRPGLTAERFVPDPFSTQPGARLYRSGDLTRYTATGQLEYLGRSDGQVKVRGFRVEPGEIAAALQTHPSVSSAVVIGQRRSGGETQLVAYVVAHAGQDPSPDELRRHLQASLPEYMWPAAVLFLPALPLTINGKLDRAALPAPNAERPRLGEAYAAPCTGNEEVLAAIWSQVLGIREIGIHDNYFALGGDSIRSLRIVAQAKERGLDVTIQQLFQHQTISKLARAASTTCAGPICPGRTQPFSLLGEVDRRKLPEDAEDAYPLSTLQAGMLYHMSLTPEAPVYHNVDSFDMRARFDETAFRAAVAHVVARHPIFRTSFDLSGYSEMIQIVHRHAELPISVQDLRRLPAAEQSVAIERCVEEERKHHFDWSQPPLLRFHILRRTDYRFQLVLTECHAILDGWSLMLTLSEIFTLYLRLLAAENVAHRPLPTLAFRDYVAQEQRELNCEAAQRFWMEKLAGAEPLKLPPWFEACRNASHKHTSKLHLPVPPPLYEGLKQVARTLAVPLKSVLLAAHVRVMGLISGQAEVLTGLGTNGRPEEEGGDEVRGLFLNIVPFRLALAGGSWAELVRAAFESERALLPYRRYPLAALEKHGRGQPLFETIFNYVHFHALEGVLSGGQVEFSDWSDFGKRTEQTHFALVTTFSLTPSGSQLDMVLDWANRGMDEEHGRAVARYYLSACEAIASAPSARYDAQDLLSASERHQLLVEWNPQPSVYPAHENIAALFEAQAARTPDALAVVMDSVAVAKKEQLTYEQLNVRANRLARYLRRLGVGPETLVGLCMERTPEMVVGMLAILKAGGGYLPLDASYPRERIAMMLEHAQVQLVLIRRRSADRLAGSTVCLLDVDAEQQAIAREVSSNLPHVTSAANLAYVMYTSGSTGQPKAVAVTQGAVNRLVCNTNYVRLEPADHMAQVSNASFDAVTFEVWGALLNGARLVILRRDVTLSAHALAAALRRHHITIMFLTTPLFHQIGRLVPNAFAAVQQLLIGGEALDPARVREVLAKGAPARLLNVYGPTESTTFAAYHLVRAVADDSTYIPIGTAIANTELYVLGRHLQPVPIGVTGELYIGGAGLARGYLRQPDLTAQRFLPHPFARTPGARIYRTGDLARWRADGALELIGRTDQQVKVRGFRIELSEVELALASHPAVAECAVRAEEGIGRGKRLLAYLVPRSSALPDAGELRSHLQEKMPEYMLPAAYVWLERLPLTANGKVDRAQLPSMKRLRSAPQSGYVAPRSRAEAQLAAIWADVLRLGQVGVYDDFFALGGDSILAIQIIARAHEARLNLTPRHLFEHPRIAELAEFIADAQFACTDQEEPAVPVSGPVPLTPVQRWFFAQDLPDPQHFNQAVLLELPPSAAFPALREALVHLFANHDALRMRFKRDDHGWVQLETAPEDALGEAPVLLAMNLCGLAMANQEEVFATQARKLQEGLDLSRGPLLRAGLFDYGPGRPARLLLVAHHLVVDWVSWRILLDDLAILLEQLARDEPPTLPAKTTSFQEWTRHMVAYAGSEALQDEATCWCAVADKPQLALPVDFTGGTNLERAARTITVALDAVRTHALLYLAHSAYHTRAIDLLVTALAQTLGTWIRTPLVTVQMEGHGREALFEDVDLSRTVGWFTALYPLQLQLSANMPPGEAIQGVKKQLRGLRHHGIAYGILRYLSPDTELARCARNQPEPQIAFNYLGQVDTLGRGLSAAPLDVAIGPLRSPRNPRPHLIDVTVYVTGGQCHAAWTYAGDAYRADTIEKVAQTYVVTLWQLIEHCQSPEVGWLAAEDFPEAGLSQADLEALVADLDTDYGD
jgi:amino acid adenylation domain-containing protein/non-ribosomal peptide synthase protein (TIGR01720 family)